MLLLLLPPPPAGSGGKAMGEEAEDAAEEGVGPSEAIISMTLGMTM